MRTPRRVRHDCPVVASTPEPASHFFGFQDLCPWNAADDKLAVMRISAPRVAMPTLADRAEICLWDPARGSVDAVAETDTWNWQQGARVQWLPGDGERLAYNRIENGRHAGVILDLDGGRERVLPFTIYTVAADGRHAISHSFARLHRHWLAYGFDGGGAPGIDHPAPDDDGLYPMDMDAGEVKLILSVAEVAAFAAGKGFGEVVHFLCHAMFSPTGRRFCFMHRFMTADGALYSRLMVADRDGGNPRVLANEKVSHFDWYDDDTLYVWTRYASPAMAAARRRGLLASPLVKPLVRLARSLRPELKQSLLKEAYYRIPVDDPKAATPVGMKALERDGHPMFSADRRWMLTDTYPGDQRMQPLILFELASQTRYDIGAFLADPKFGDRDIKCDLHPRWNRANTKVCIDSTHTGMRQVHIVDVADLIAN